MPCCLLLSLGSEHVRPPPVIERRHPSRRQLRVRILRQHLITGHDREVGKLLEEGPVVFGKLRNTFGSAVRACCCGDRARFATTIAPALAPEVEGMARKLALPTVPSVKVATEVSCG
jgi:hypothetical protein